MFDVNSNMYLSNNIHYKINLNFSKSLKESFHKGKKCMWFSIQFTSKISITTDSKFEQNKRHRCL